MEMSRHSDNRESSLYSGRVARQRVPWLALGAFLACTSLALASASETIVGTVWNGTTGKASAGDDVALLTVSKGSLEVSRGRTAESGLFHLQTNVTGTHVIRVRHDGVIYQQEVKAGVSPRIEVFSSQSTLDGIHGSVTIMKMETSGEQMWVTELHSITNDSNPPRTLVNARNLEVLVPSDATLDSVVVEGPSWRPERVNPKLLTTGSRDYAVGYPLRPGTTQFAIKYHLPYHNSAAFHPHLQYPTKLWTVMFPKEIHFKAQQERRFRSFVSQDGMQVEALNEAKAGDLPSFVISGAGSDGGQTAKSALQLPILSQSARFPSPTRADTATPPIERRLIASRSKGLVWAGLGIAVMMLGLGAVRSRRSTKRRLAYESGSRLAS